MQTRRAILRAGIDPATDRCLEIGALADPIIAKAEGNVTFVDHADTAQLRDTYRDDPGVDIARIVEVDAVWGEQTLGACVGGAVFDYVLASHVAEHVPDLITWLQEVHDVLAPHGQLRLVLPDHRFSFDALRDETRLVDVLTNWVLRARRPQVHNVLDFRLHYAPAMDCWAEYEGRYDRATLAPAHDFDVAIESARWARDLPETYFDVHCWVFRPRSFARVMEQLAGRGLVRFACVDFIDTAPPLFEFYCFLSPCDDPAQAAASWRAVGAAARHPVRAAPPAAEPDARLAAAQAEIAALKASSSWRITAPMRWVAQRLLPSRQRHP